MPDPVSIVLVLLSALVVHLYFTRGQVDEELDNIIDGHNQLVDTMAQHLQHLDERVAFLEGELDD